ncbi:hypothetical protein RvY_07982 [Ramazzottius varieornatus]|uniref:Uncharacterized protein n=1 Tax=Ramazzottius varieornatus TaxID=947166 RepID=A0A1D1V917_RAMVA|nr:hypothetical protein RvY_07982 [Ramazzottius varieornatus]
MCRIGAYQDYHGIGVANIIFGLACIVLPDHSLYDTGSIFGSVDGASPDFLRATDAITILTGILLLITGILCMVYARRFVENLPVNRVMQSIFIFALLTILLCPVMFALNLISTADAMDSPYSAPGSSSGSDDDSSTGSSTTDRSTVDAPSAPANITIDIGNLLTSFMFISRYLEYKYGVSAAITIIAVSCFFMNVALLCIVCKQRSFRIFGRQPVESMPSHAIQQTTRIAYQTHGTENGNSSVVIQPLPAQLGQSPRPYSSLSDETVTPNATPNGHHQRFFS